ncbi:MAG TPA: CHAT domain-containing tetratricopeptide repeat protein, partial [Burkholderiales bacterium]|nr:CHAT domain-containing tetratricopeptide repeat protein [Burkholderiales bacterium]
MGKPDVGIRPAQAAAAVRCMRLGAFRRAGAGIGLSLLFAWSVLHGGAALAQTDADAADLSRRGMALVQRGQYADAVPLLQQAYGAHVQQQGERHPDTLRSQGDLVSVLVLVRPQEALPLAEALLRLRRETLGEKNPQTLAAMESLGFVYYKLSRYEDELALDRQLLELRNQTLGEKHPQSLRSLRGVAIDYQNLNRQADSLPLLEQALRLTTEALGERHEDSRRLLVDVANANLFLSRYAEALRLYARNLELSSALFGADGLQTLQAMSMVATAYGYLGRDDQALPIRERYYRAQLRRSGEKSRDTIHTSIALAQAYINAGRPAEAVPLLQRALALRGEVFGEGDRDTIYFFDVLAEAYETLGKPADALPLRRQSLALQLADVGADSFTAAESMSALAQTLLALHPGPPEQEEALALHQRALDVRVRSFGDNNRATVQSLIRLGRAYTAQQQPAAALPLYRRVVAAAEAMRAGGDLGPDDRQALFAQWVDIYKSEAGLLVDAGQGEEAFRLAELSKARTLLESAALRRANNAGVLDAAEAGQVQDFERRIAALASQIALSREASRRLVLETEKNKLTSEFAALRRELALRHPKYGQLSEVRILGSDAAARILPAGAALLSYLWDGEDVIAFVATPSHLVAQRLPRTPGLAGSIEAYRALVAEPQGATSLFTERGRRVWRRSDGTYLLAPAEAPPPAGAVRVANAQEIGRVLGERLLQPLAKHLEGISRLVISPDAALALVPFEALDFGGKPLIADIDISYTQSLSMLALLHDRDSAAGAPRKSLFAMGGAEYAAAGPARPASAPARGGVNLQRMVARGDGQAMGAAFGLLGVVWNNLPGSEIEVTEVAHLFGEQDADVSKNKNATEAQLQRLNGEHALARYKYLLFSTHGYLSTEEPALSAIVLGQLDKAPGTDGFVTAGEWPAYDLRSDLMVLSACDTGVGAVVRGEGVMGLPYSLYVAGNRNTLLTLWPVVDASTTRFMVAFFRRLKEGVPQVRA